jgi:hypothetical protein
MSRTFCLLVLALCALAAPACDADRAPAGPPLPPAGAADLPRPAVGVAVVTTTPAAGAPAALAVLSAYNRRDLGSPGRRHVLLELLTGSEVTRTFEVENAWARAADGVSTLFLLTEPRGLRGTSYLLTEAGERQADMRVSLYLPAGQRQVLTLSPDNHDEGLLGSDFTYNDLRMQLPLGGYAYEVAGQTVLLGRHCWVVGAKPVTPDAARAVAWRSARLYFASDFPFLLGADYYDTAGDRLDEHQALKRLRVESVEQRAGVWTATRITMHGRDGRSSVLTLTDAAFGLAETRPELFSPANLASVAEQVRAGGALDSWPAAK